MLLMLLRAVPVEYFEECGYPVLEAETADAAVSMLQENVRIGAVFCDVQMPGTLDGIGLAQWIAHERADVTVVLTSGQVRPPAAKEWRFFAKPYRLAEVERALHARTA